MNQSDHAVEAGNPFAAARAGALADLQAQVAEAAEPTPAPAVAPPPETPTQPTLDVEASTPEIPLSGEPAPLPMELFEFKADGRDVKMTRDEVIEHAQKGLNFTRKTQALADRERQVQSIAQENATLRQREAEIAQFLNNPTAVGTWQQQLLARQGGFKSPDEVPTQADVAVTVQSEAAKIRAEMRQSDEETQRKVTATLFNIEAARKTAEYQIALDSHFQSLISANETHLSAYNPADLNLSVRSEVGQRIAAAIEADPDVDLSVDQVKDWFRNAVDRRVTRVRGRYEDHQKAAAARAAKLIKNAPEPPGGVAPAATPSTAPKSFRLGDKDLTAAAIDDVRRAFGGS